MVSRPDPAHPDAGPLERMPHLYQQVQKRWQTAELSPWINTVILDSRDGERHGLPPAVADELMLLADVNRMARAMRRADRDNITYVEALRQQTAEDAAARKHNSYDDALDDPLASRDTLRGRERAAPRVITRGARQNDSGTWGAVLGLLTNKWLLALVVIGVLANAYWPTLGPALKALLHVVR